MAEAEPITAEVAGNRLALLADGRERLGALLSLIEGAQESLRILYYIMLEDETGARVRDALAAAAARGVEVSLLVDGFGSTANAAFYQPLVDAGIGFCRFSPKWGRRYLLRNHQKLALADGAKVLIGGFNVADEYFAPLDQDGWRDIGLTVEGPSVGCLAGYFDDLFHWSQAHDRGIRDLRRLLQQHSAAEGPLRWLFGGPARRLSPWARAVRRDMLSAKCLDLIAAYFAPTPSILRRITKVARGGGRARLITAARADVPAATAAARSLYWYLLKRGVEIYEHRASRLHTKLVVIDDVVHIGSANFDMRSLFLNLEMMLRIEDAGFAAAMRGFFDREAAASERITPQAHDKERTLLNRLRWGLGYFLVAVADYRITRRLNG